MLVGDLVMGEIVCFMIGLNKCEVIGLCWFLDCCMVFVGI